MSRSGRRYVVAIIGLLVVTALLSGVAIYYYQQFTKATKDPYAKERYQPARDPVRPKTSPQGQPQSQAYQPNCQQPQNHADADLCAQWSAVKAVTETNRLTRLALGLAALGFLFAVFGALVGLAGTVLIWLAWRETRAANRVARRDYARGRLEARKAAKAAEESLSHAKSISAAELRPYLFVERIELIDIVDHDPPKLEGDEATEEDDPFARGLFRARAVIYFKNFGRVPARNIKVYAKSYVGKLYIGRFWRYKLSVIDLWICAPGHERRAFIPVYIFDYERNDFETGSIDFILRLRFTFEDDEGNRFEERAAFSLSGNALDTFYLLPRLQIGVARQRQKQRELELVRASAPKRRRRRRKKTAPKKPPPKESEA